METNQSSANQNLTGSEVQPQQTGSNQKLFFAVVISALLTSMLTGSAVYFWQKSTSEKAINNLRQEITTLRNQVSQVDTTQTTPLPTSQPKSQPSVDEPTADPAVNWKTFSSKKFNYKIKYSPEMILGDRPSGAPDYYDDVSFSIVGEKGKSGHMVDGLNVNIRTEENNQELSLKDWVKDKYSEEYPSVTSTEDFLIAGLNAVRVLGQGMYPFDEVIIPQEKKVLIIQGVYVGENKQEYKGIYNAMLSSFKLTN